MLLQFTYEIKTCRLNVDGGLPPNSTVGHHVCWNAV